MFFMSFFFFREIYFENKNNVCNIFWLECSFSTFPDRFGSVQQLWSTCLFVVGLTWKRTGDTSTCRCSSSLWYLHCRCAVDKSTYLPHLVFLLSTQKWAQLPLWRKKTNSETFSTCNHHDFFSFINSQEFHACISYMGRYPLTCWGTIRM